MITIAVCDDEAVFIDIVTDEVRSAMTAMNRKYSFCSFRSSEEFLKAVESGSLVPDVVFLDIVMPVVDGKEIALIISELYPECSVIFMTSHEDEIFTSFDYNVSGFISKFSLSEKIYGNLERVLKKKDTASPVTANLTVYNEKGTPEHIRIKLADIIYLECSMKKAYMTLADGTVKRVKCDMWRELVHRFEGDTFAVPHQNYLVNMGYITKISASDVFLDKTEAVIPLSKYRRRDFIKQCAHYSGGIK